MQLFLLRSIHGMSRMTACLEPGPFSDLDSDSQCGSPIHILLPWKDFSQSTTLCSFSVICPHSGPSQDIRHHLCLWTSVGCARKRGSRSHSLCCQENPSWMQISLWIRQRHAGREAGLWQFKITAIVLYFNSLLPAADLSFFPQSDLSHFVISSP